MLTLARVLTISYIAQAISQAVQSRSLMFVQAKRRRVKSHSHTPGVFREQNRANTNVHSSSPSNRGSFVNSPKNATDHDANLKTRCDSFSGGARKVSGGVWQWTKHASTGSYTVGPILHSCDQGTSIPYHQFLYQTSISKNRYNLDGTLLKRQRQLTQPGTFFQRFPSANDYPQMVASLRKMFGNVQVVGDSGEYHPAFRSLKIQYTSKVAGHYGDIKTVIVRIGRTHTCSMHHDYNWRHDTPTNEDSQKRKDKWTDDNTRLQDCAHTMLVKALVLTQSPCFPPNHQYRTQYWSTSQEISLARKQPIDPEFLKSSSSQSRAATAPKFVDLGMAKYIRDLRTQPDLEAIILEHATIGNTLLFLVHYTHFAMIAWGQSTKDYEVNPNWVGIEKINAELLGAYLTSTKFKQAPSMSDLTTMTEFARHNQCSYVLFLRRLQISSAIANGALLEEANAKARVSYFRQKVGFGKWHLNRVRSARYHCSGSLNTSFGDAYQCTITKCLPCSSLVFSFLTTEISIGGYDATTTTNTNDGTKIFSHVKVKNFCLNRACFCQLKPAPLFIKATMADSSRPRWTHRPIAISGTHIHEVSISQQDLQSLNTLERTVLRGLHVKMVILRPRALVT